MATSAADLDASRAVHRARRLEAVPAVLCRQRATGASFPRALDQAIHGFSDQLTQMRKQLPATWR